MMRYEIFSMRWATASRESVSGSGDSCKHIIIGIFHNNYLVLALCMINSTVLLLNVRLLCHCPLLQFQSIQRRAVKKTIVAMNTVLIDDRFIRFNSVLAYHILTKRRTVVMLWQYRKVYSCATWRAIKTKPLSSNAANTCEIKLK